MCPSSCAKLAEPLVHAIHDLSRSAGEASGMLSSVVAWTVNALGGAAVGIIVGATIATIVRRFTKRTKELIVD